MSETLLRVRLALKSENPIRRGVDFVCGRALAAAPDGLRRRLFAGSRCYCPVCEARLSGFLNLYRHYNLLCPICGSLQRHRFMAIFIQEWLMPRLPLDRTWKMLHIAPEPGLTARFSALPGIEYLSADLFNPLAMEQMDICDIHHPAKAFDLIYCSHVLEHVEDDRKALREFHRVLTADGLVVIAVPITSPSTFEDPAVTSPFERERLFGQHDHLRVYGWDVVERFKQAGFTVRVIHRSDLVGESAVERMGLAADETLFVLDKSETSR